MTETQDNAQRIDGRVARRQRNIDAVLDVVLEMFGEDAMYPSIEQVAKRSGLSLRSLYRYYADPGGLIEAAVERNNHIAVELSRLHDIGRGPLERRIDDFASMRLTLHDRIGPVLRAALVNAPIHPSIRDDLTRDRNKMREQFELQFAPELSSRMGAQRKAVASAGDLVTQLESIEYLRRHRQLSVAEAHATITTSLLALLS